jgi:hypothetical protein
VFGSRAGNGHYISPVIFLLIVTIHSHSCIFVRFTAWVIWPVPIHNLSLKLRILLEMLVQLLGRRIGSSQGLSLSLSLPTQDKTTKRTTWKYSRALNGIRTDDPRVQAVQHHTHLDPRDHWDRLTATLTVLYIYYDLHPWSCR